METVKKIFQAALGIASAIILGIIIPYQGWGIVIEIAEGLKNLGFSIDLVGEPSGVDLGAIIVQILYLSISALVSYCTLKKYKSFSIALMASSIIMSFFVFSLVSSLIWF